MPAGDVIPCRKRSWRVAMASVPSQRPATFLQAWKNSGCAQTINGAGGIGTGLENPMNSAFPEEGGAKSGALDSADPHLMVIIEGWARLSDALKAGIVAMVKAANGESLHP